MDKPIKTPKHFPPIIIPVCVYHRASPQGVFQGYIGTPAVAVNGKGEEILTCADPGAAYQGWYKAGHFYGINPMFTSIPSYMRLICAKQSKTGERNYNTIWVHTVYDPFHLDPDCVYFLSWTLPVPYTTPIHLYKSGRGILPSFEKRPDLPSSGLTTLYVLTDEPTPTTIFAEKKNWFTKQKDGTPNFLFKNYMGRCIPDPDGVSIEQCSLKHDLNLVRPLSLLDYLDEMVQKQNKTQFAASVPRFFKKVKTPWVTVVLVVFLLALVTVLFLLFKNKNDNSGGKHRRK